MIKSSTVNVTEARLPYLPLYLGKRLRGVWASMLNSGIMTGDFKYVWNFVKYYRNELYKRHTDENYINCVFCSNLVRTGCHKHCLKCGVGTYIRCSPSLPGVLYNESGLKENKDGLNIPWYFKETCSHFERLSQRKYFKNLHSVLSPAGVYDYEALEGLEEGLSGGMKPCHVCAAVDYELYKRCSSRDDFDEEVPCNSIDAELKSFYISRDANTKVS